jgi:CubicO group peptidase (beta-lactamase class C family)
MMPATGRAIYLGEGLARSGFVVLALLGGTPTLVGCSTPPAPIHVSDPMYWPTAEWRKSAPEAQGLDSEKLADMLDAVRTRGIPIHSLQVIRNGYLALDTYFYPYNSHDLHDTASVTKSVTATLVGIAVAQGLVPSVTTPLLSMFPGRAIASRDSTKDAVTLEDLLTMRPGLACEEVPGEPTLHEMRQHADWLQFMLDRPMARASGRDSFIAAQSR